MSNDLSKARLKLWVRLLGVTRSTESTLREFLRLNHQSTLPRFDVMAALYRRREGTTMSELSRMLLVSNGNATTVVDRLDKEGLTKRSASLTDRRTVHVALTPAGVDAFEKQAVDIEAEINNVFDELTAEEIETVTTIFKRIGGKK